MIVKVRAVCLLKKNGVDKEAEKHLEPDEIDDFKRQTSIIVDNRYSYFDDKEEVKLNLKIKNVSKMNIKIYEIDLEKHCLSGNATALESLELAYYQPQSEFEVDVFGK